MTSNIVRRFRPVPVSLLPFDFDAGIYDGIIATIRRQGFLDALGCDLVPARQDHGNAYEFHVKAAARARKREAREAEWRGRSAERAEAAERERNLARQRVADEQWTAEEARRRVRMLEAVERDRTLILLAVGIDVRNKACAANGSLTCHECGLADQSMILPPPSYDNEDGYFAHNCAGCGTVFHLSSKQLAREVRRLRALAA